MNMICNTPPLLFDSGLAPSGMKGGGGGYCYISPRSKLFCHGS